MTTSKYKLPVFILFLLFVVPLVADPEPTFDRVSFNVTVMEEVLADTIIGKLGISLQGKDTSQMAAKINTTITAALKSIKSFKGIEVETLNYQTTPVYQQGRQSGLWEVSQSILLKSRDFDEFSKAVHKLQQSLNLLSVNYQLSTAARTTTEDRLTTAVIQRFSARALQLSKDFGFNEYRIVSVNLGSNPTYVSQPKTMARRSQIESFAAAPVFQAGKQQVTVNLSGTIEMLR